MARGDIIQDEKGNMPLLDFQGDDGREEKKFEDIYDIKEGGAMKLPERAPRAKTTKKKLRKLKKKRDQTPDKLDEGDEILDLELNMDSDIDLNGSEDGNENGGMAIESTPMFKEGEDDSGEAQF